MAARTAGTQVSMGVTTGMGASAAAAAAAATMAATKAAVVGVTAVGVAVGMSVASVELSTEDYTPWTVQVEAEVPISFAPTMLSSDPPSMVPSSFQSCYQPGS